MQTLVFLHSLYKCYAKWSIVWKRYSCEQEQAHIALFPPARLIEASLTGQTKCFQMCLLKICLDTLNYSLNATHLKVFLFIICHLISKIYIILANNNFGCKISITI